MTTTTITRESIECQDCGIPIVITEETKPVAGRDERGFWHRELYTITEPVSGTVYACRRCEAKHARNMAACRARGNRGAMLRSSAYQRAPRNWPVRG